MMRRAGGTAALLLLVLVSCGHSRYVLPVADGSDEEPSLPGVDGRLVEIINAELVVERRVRGNWTGKTTRVIVTAETKIFGAYGGFVPYEELVPGQKVRVWFTKPRWPRSAGLPVVAVLQLASEDPRFDWPE